MTSNPSDIQQCPMKGKHLTPMHQDACPVCSQFGLPDPKQYPPMPATELPKGAQRTSKERDIADELLEAVTVLDEPFHREAVAGLLGRASGLIQRLRSDLEERPYYLDGLTIQQWREHAKAGWKMYAARAENEPAATRKPDKFDMAFEIMRQLEAEDMETMQSCQFGYVMRVTRERVPSPPVTDYGVTPTLAAIRMAIKTFDEDRNERRVLEEIQETVRHALPPPATHQFSIGDKVRLGSGGMQREVVGIIERYRITINAGAGWMAVDGDNLELVERASETKPVWTNEMVAAVERDAEALGQRMAMGKVSDETGDGRG